MIKNENYINISGWMVNELKLKGNELLIFAIIYGFSQDGQNTFSGSLKYLENWCNSTKQGVIKNLKSLCEKGYIGRREKIINGVKFVDYYATEFTGVVNKVYRGGEQSLTGGGKQSLPHNTNIDNTNNNKENRIPTIEEVKEFCRERNSCVDPEAFWNYYNSQKWLKSNGKPLSDWRSGVRYWERTEKGNKQKNRQQNKQQGTDTKALYQKLLEEEGGC